MTSSFKVGVIIGSTRQGRNGLQVGQWVMEQIQKSNNGMEPVLVDLALEGLPFLDEPVPASRATEYAHEHTRRWSKKVASLDAVVFVTPEYNAGPPGVLKNAIDFLCREWSDKPAGIVSYGGGGGLRAATHLRTVLSNVKMNIVPSQASFLLAKDFESYTTFNPREDGQAQFTNMMGEIRSVLSRE